jgi:hypothetical protein
MTAIKFHPITKTTTSSSSTTTTTMTTLFQSNYNGEYNRVTPTCHGNENEDNKNDRIQSSLINQPIILTIPIFPLRKKIRLPTEFLKLNLYETRYIQMARYIVRKQQTMNKNKNMTNTNDKNTMSCPAMFGAIYCANKPHIKSKAIGPIVPYIQANDIGILYLIQEYQDNDDDVIRLTGQDKITLHFRQISSLIRVIVLLYFGVSFKQ